MTIFVLVALFDIAYLLKIVAVDFIDLPCGTSMLLHWLLLLCGNTEGCKGGMFDIKVAEYFEVAP